MLASILDRLFACELARLHDQACARMIACPLVRLHVGKHALTHVRCLVFVRSRVRMWERMFAGLDVPSHVCTLGRDEAARIWREAG